MSPWEEQNLFIWQTTENWQMNFHPSYEFVIFENKIWSAPIMKNIISLDKKASYN